MSALPARETRYAPVLDAEATKPLSREEEQVQTRRYRASRCPHALRRLVEANQHFVIMVARQYQGNGLPLEDLVSEGNVGLLQAAERFDPDKGIKFITYAVWWIRRAILQALSDQARLVRLPKYKIRQVRDLRERVEVLRGELGREPTVSDVSEATGIPERQVEQLLTLGSFEVSMDVETESGDQSPFDAYLSEDRVEDGHYETEVGSILRQAIAELTPKEQHVVLRRFEFVPGPGTTLEVISKEMGLTKERVRQIELRAKKRLRAWLESGQRSVQVVNGSPW
ncbi:MAG: RNA polymerase sigma factor RpoD/SigA [Acidobacteriota bacterium]